MTDRAAILAALEPGYAVESVVLAGVSLRPAPAVLVARLAAREDGLDEAMDDPTLFEDMEFLRAILDPERLRPVFSELIAACASHLSDRDRRRVAGVGPTDFLRLAAESFIVSMPIGTSALFDDRPFSDEDDESEDEWDPGVDVDPDPVEMAADIAKAACRLKAAGHDDAYSMSWTRLRFAEAVEGERARNAMADAAVATRAAKIENRKFDKFLKKLRPGRG